MARYNKKAMKEREEWVRSYLKKNPTASARAVRDEMLKHFAQAIGSKKIGQLRGEAKVEKAIARAANIEKLESVSKAIPKAIPLPGTVEQALQALETFMRREDISSMTLEMSSTNEILVKATKIERREVFLPFQAAKLS